MSTVFDEAVLEDRPEIDLSVFGSVRAEPERPVILSLDIGTSGARAALFDSRGEEIEGSSVSLTHQFPALIQGEDVDANQFADFIESAIDAAVERAEIFVSRIDYVGAACFWHSLVGTDDQGRAVTPLLGWADTRAAGAAKELRAKFNETKSHARTGARFHPSYWPAKLLWLRNEQRQLFDQTAQWLSISDYLFLRLFGYATTSISMASATGLFNQQECDWDRESCDGLGISDRQLPALADAATFQLSFVDHKKRWPLLESATWFPAIGDGAANNIGAGCIDKQWICLMLGTSGAMRVMSQEPLPASLPSELFCYRADRDRIVVGGALSDGGGLQTWMQQTLAVNFSDDELNRLIEQIEPDSHGLTVLPFWSGERATGWSPSARGAINGLKASTTPIEIMRAAMEAICYRFALISRSLDSIAPGASIRAVGKIFHAYPCWAQIMSDVLGRRIQLSSAPEVTLGGAALLALETIGTIDSLEPFKPDIRRVFVPDMKSHEIYLRAIERQKELYEKLI